MRSKLEKRKKRALRSHYNRRGKSQFRLCVCRSNRNFHAQLIDDYSACTVYHVSTLSKEFSRPVGKLNSDVVSNLGDFFAKNLPESYKGAKIVFDSGYSAYHGLVALFADKVRSCLVF